MPKMARPLHQGAVKRAATVLADGRHNIHDLAAKAALKIPGSIQHRKLWRHYCHRFCEDVQEGLRRDTSIGSRVDSAAARILESDLGVIGANKGIMPDFSNEAALRGYTLKHFGRARLLGDLMALAHPDWLESRVADLFTRGGSMSNSKALLPPSRVTLASLGGGPGFDFVSTAALSEYRRGPSIHATVYEYEMRWKDIVSSLEETTKNVSGDNRHSCDFDRCDITLPLSDDTNASVAKGLPSTDVFACSYCVAENAVALDNRRWIFFRDLFEESIEGSLFFFTDTTHRLWPTLMDIAQDAGLRFATPHLRSGKVGWQFAALKDGNPGTRYYSAIDQGMYKRFKIHNQAHLKRLGKGWKREARKVPGAKAT